jgi:hypothetical protein
MPSIFLLAWLIPNNSRDQVIEHVFQHGHGNSSCGDRNPLVELVIFFGLIGMLHAAWMIVDSLRIYRLWRRVNRVDRHRAAIVLSMLADSNTGLPPLRLCRIGEKPEQLRQLLAYLMLFEWIQVSPQGDLVWMRSPTMRGLHFRRDNLAERANRPAA